VKNSAVYYDCLIVSTDPAAVEYQGRTLPGVRVPAGAAPGAVGVVSWHETAAAWAFASYADPSLTRCPELDQSGRLGWSNARRPAGWTAPRGLIPGAVGLFVEDETEQVTISVPQEFFGLCGLFGVSAATALRAFIADACSLENTQEDPRADRYNRTSQGGTNAAEDYFNAAFSSRVDLSSLTIFRIDEDSDEDDEECRIIQIPKHHSHCESTAN
jgi:hypothetical protein